MTNDEKNIEMEYQEIIRLLSELTAICGPSGREESVRAFIMSEIKDYVDNIYTDVSGNLVAVKQGTGKKVMVAAHMDEIGVIITHIDEKGFLRFANIGGVSAYSSLYKRVRFKNGTTGVVGYETKKASLKELKLSDMFVDIGAKSREEAEKFVRVGDAASFMAETVIQNDTAIGKSMDDRSGCCAVIYAIQHLAQTENTIYFVFTVQEEVGLRGAKAAAFNIAPDLAIAVDVTATGDTPGCSTMEVAYGKGPAIKIMDRSIICHPMVRQYITQCAEKLQIQVQREILEFGGNEAGAIHLECGGIPSGTISIPCRYLHSVSETVSIKDIYETAILLSEAVTTAFHA